MKMSLVIWTAVLAGAVACSTNSDTSGQTGDDTTGSSSSGSSSGATSGNTSGASSSGATSGNTSGATSGNTSGASSSGATSGNTSGASSSGATSGSSSDDGHHRKLSDGQRAGIMAELNEGEVLVAQAARPTLQDPRVQAFADQMVSEHGQAAQQLAALGIVIEDSPLRRLLQADAQATAAMMGQQTAPATDLAYLDSQVRMHGEALGVIELVLANDGPGDDGTGPKGRHGESGEDNRGRGDGTTDSGGLGSGGGGSSALDAMLEVMRVQVALHLAAANQLRQDLTGGAQR